jgi:hypothetical protein
VEKSTVPRSLSLSAPFAVVIQTWAEAVPGEGAAAAAFSPPAPATAMMTPVASRLADPAVHSFRSIGGPKDPVVFRTELSLLFDDVNLVDGDG